MLDMTAAGPKFWTRPDDFIDLCAYDHLDYNIPPWYTHGHARHSIHWHVPFQSEIFRRTARNDQRFQSLLKYPAYFIFSVSIS
jgi:hypothetical protein